MPKGREMKVMPTIHIKEGTTVETAEEKRIVALEEALRELVSIVEIHQNATQKNFAWAELELAKGILAL